MNAIGDANDGHIGKVNGNAAGIAVGNAKDNANDNGRAMSVSKGQ